MTDEIDRYDIFITDNSEKPAKKPIASFAFSAHARSWADSLYEGKYILKAVPAPDTERQRVAEALLEACEALISKMHHVYGTDEYKCVWFTAQNHNGPYTGENWIKELNALDAATEAAKALKAVTK